MKRGLLFAVGDRATLEKSAREMVWILQGWGRTEEADILEHKRATELARQMPLPFLPAPPARGVTGPTGWFDGRPPALPGRQ